MTKHSIQAIPIEREMREAYLSYAMSVIVARALPDARDGLKPVHRRILYAMHDMGISANSAHKKSARIVGEVLGKYHPHGDSAVYETMVRMAQDFSMRYMLLDGQGNFGSIDGDAAAAMRYTEARMAGIGDELLVDIDKNTVDFIENFDGSLDEPTVLPALVPNLLINGASGIAVGMSTNIPPHNLGEICQALLFMLEQWQRLDNISVDELMQFVKGPDFPTGGLIYKYRDGKDMLRQAMSTGRAKITLRAKVHIEDMGYGKSRIIVSELPFQTNKTALIERIASLVRAGKLEGLADLRDESDRQNPVRLVIELQRGCHATDALAQLFKLTSLQSTFGIIMLALDAGQPRMLSLKQALRVYLDHRLVVIQRRARYDLARAEARAHILQGLLIALDELDAVIKVIRSSRSSDSARKKLVAQFAVSQLQAQAILDMPLRRLAALEISRIRQEYREKQRLIKSLQELLAQPKKQRRQITSELKEIQATYADARRSIIAESEADGIAPRDFLLPEEETVVLLSAHGKLGRTHQNEPPKITRRTKDPPRLLQHSSTNEILYLFTEDGRCASLPVQQIPPVQQAAAGMRYSDLLPLRTNNAVVAFLCLPASLQGGYLCLFTARGLVKRLELQDLPGVMTRDFRVMNVAPGDRLIAARCSNGSDDLVLTRSSGYAIRFSEQDVRSTKLNSRGVRGIQLNGDDDHVVAAFLSDDRAYGWNITAGGYTKILPLAHYPKQVRNGKGSPIMPLYAQDDPIVAATCGKLDDTVLVLTSKQKAKYMSLGLAEKAASAGKPVIALGDKERVEAVVEYRPRLSIEADAPAPAPKPALGQMYLHLDAPSAAPAKDGAKSPG